MNKLILCEGATDAILLSYYLEKATGWKYSKKPPKNLDIRTDSDNETVNWYKKDDDFLLIVAVGGKDNFSSFFRKRIKPPLLAVNAFERIAVITDRDNREQGDIEKTFNLVFEGVNVTMKSNVWMAGSYIDDFAEQQNLGLLLVVIPEDQQGALETLMLDSISVNPYDRTIVESAGIFIGKMRKEASRYISSDRLQLKAHLGVTWAVQYQEKVFSLVDEQIRNVKWEESDILNRCFRELIRI